MKKQKLTHSAKNVWKIKKKVDFQGEQKKQIEEKFSQAVRKEMEESEFDIKIKI